MRIFRFYGKHGGSQPGAGNKKTDVTYGRISRDVRYLYDDDQRRILQKADLTGSQRDYEYKKWCGFMALYRRKRPLWIVISNHLFLLDVSEDDVMEDYLKTNKAAITRVEKIKKETSFSRIASRKNRKNRGLFVAKEEFLNAALKTMKEEYGSINQFMIKGLNISMQQKEDFKQKVLE